MAEAARHTCFVSGTLRIGQARRPQPAVLPPSGGGGTPTASAGLDRELTPAAFSRFASAYESYAADHAWALDWGVTVSHDQVTVPVSTDQGANTATARMLALVATDPHVVQVRFEDRYLFAVVIESVDPLATRALLAPALGDLPTMRVVGPGETLHP